jgi:hypothetical protein
MGLRFCHFLKEPEEGSEQQESRSQQEPGTLHIEWADGNPPQRFPEFLVSQLPLWVTNLQIYRIGRVNERRCSGPEVARKSHPGRSVR